MNEISQLILRAKQNDHNAFTEIVRKFQNMALGYAYSVVGDFELAKDIAQESFVQAYIDLNKLQFPEAFPNWFRKIIFKYCDRQYRGKRLWTEVYEDTSFGTQKADDPQEKAEKREMIGNISKEINRLGKGEKEATTLYYINGYSQAEISEFLDIPIGTVKSRLHLARKKLKKRMEHMLKDTFKNNKLDKSFDKKIQAILDGVDDLEWKKGNICFCGAVAAVMKYLGQDVTYDYIAGVSGGAFISQWHPDLAPDNCDILVLGDEPIERTFSALGYEYVNILDFDKMKKENSEQNWKYKIIESIDQNIPVIGKGIVGPPECCVITGYAEKGSVLYGRSYFYNESKGYFRKKDWYNECSGMILIGKKTANPNKKEILINSLNHALFLAKTAETGNKITGLAVFPAIKEFLLNDDNFNTGKNNESHTSFDDLSLLEKQTNDKFDRLTLICMALNNDGFSYLMGARYSASGFIKEIIHFFPEAEKELQSAADLFTEEFEILMQGRKKSPGAFTKLENKLRILEKDLRLELAELINKAHECEIKAFDLIGKALVKIQG